MPRVIRAGTIVLFVSFLFALHYLLPTWHQPPLPDAYTSSSSFVSPHSPLSRSKNHAQASRDVVDVDSKGLTRFVPGKTSRHPIELLIDRAKVQAAQQEARIREVVTLEDAVEEYEMGFGMKPSRGFELWYRFTQSSPVPHPPPVAPLLPSSHNPLLSFLSLPIDILRERVAEVRSKGAIFTFTFMPDGQGDKGTACEMDQEWEPKDWARRGKGRVKVQGEGGWKWRCNNTLTLLLPILPLLPPQLFTMDPPLELAFSIDDGPRGMVHNDLRERSEALAWAGKVWSKSQLAVAEKKMGWTYGWSAWPLHLMNRTEIVIQAMVMSSWFATENPQHRSLHNDLDEADFDLDADTTLGRPKSFIADFGRAADCCYNPDLMDYHHVLLSEQHRAAVDLVPVVVTCRTKWNSDVVGVPLDGVHETVEYVPWEEKSIGKAFWRGTATGLFHSKNTRWRSSQRERLHFLAQNGTNEFHPLLLDRTGYGGGLGVEGWSTRDLNDKWLDVGLSGSPVQCSQEDGTCDEMTKDINFMGRSRKEDSSRYKFVIDVDGNGWSSRFRRLLAGNNVVLKSTLYPEWFQELLIPWYHYVPLKLDYSDLYDILAFFQGAPDGSSPGRDDLSKEIAEQGLTFTEDRWRMEDMQSFMFLLILEYWRVMSEDREAASYQS